MQQYAEALLDQTWDETAVCLRVTRGVALIQPR
jgi:hypothetical protein